MIFNNLRFSYHPSEHCIHAHTHTHTHTCAYVYIHIYIYIYIYIYNKYIYIYINIYINKNTVVILGSEYYEVLNIFVETLLNIKFKRTEFI